MSNPDLPAPSLALIPNNMPVPAPASETAAILHMIERAARDPAVDIDKLERLLDRREQIEDRAAERAFNAAMALAQSEMRPIAKDADNPQTHSKYASYFALDRAVRQIYTDHGFGLSFDTDPTASQGSDLMVVCYVSHRLGHNRTYRLPMPADGKGAKGGDVMTRTHAAGSAMTYGRRYLLQAIFNLAIGGDRTDDDGNRAGVAKNGIIGSGTSIYKRGDYAGGTPEHNTKPEQPKIYSRGPQAAYDALVKEIETLIDTGPSPTEFQAWGSDNAHRCLKLPQALYDAMNRFWLEASERVLDNWNQARAAQAFPAREENTISSRATALRHPRPIEDIIDDLN